MSGDVSWGGPVASHSTHDQVSVSKAQVTGGSSSDDLRKQLEKKVNKLVVLLQHTSESPAGIEKIKQKMDKLNQVVTGSPEKCKVLEEVVNAAFEAKTINVDLKNLLLARKEDVSESIKRYLGIQPSSSSPPPPSSSSPGASSSSTSSMKVTAPLIGESKQLEFKEKLTKILEKVKLKEDETANLLAKQPSGITDSDLFDLLEDESRAVMNEVVELFRLICENPNLIGKEKDSDISRTNFLNALKEYGVDTQDVEKIEKTVDVCFKSKYFYSNKLDNVFTSSGVRHYLFIYYYNVKTIRKFDEEARFLETYLEIPNLYSITYDSLSTQEKGFIDIQQDRLLIDGGPADFRRELSAIDVNKLDEQGKENYMRLTQLITSPTSSFQPPPSSSASRPPPPSSWSASPPPPPPSSSASPGPSSSFPSPPSSSSPPSPSSSSPSGPSSSAMAASSSSQSPWGSRLHIKPASEVKANAPPSRKVQPTEVSYLSDLMNNSFLCSLFTEKQLKTIVSTGMKCKPESRGKLLLLKGKEDMIKREVYIRKMEDNSLGITVLQGDYFDKGSYGEVYRGERDSSETTLGVVKKVNIQGKEGRREMKEEIKRLRYFAENGGEKHHVQTGLYSVAKEGFLIKKIKGYYAEEYAGNCKNLAGKLDIACDVIRQINEGLSFLLKHGYCQTDHKLGNVLQKTVDGRLHVDVSDLGSAVPVKEEVLIRRFRKFKKLARKSDIFDAQEMSKLSFSHTGETTCNTIGNDIKKLFEYIKTCSDTEMPECAKRWKTILEKHMVYSQAVVALSLCFNPYQLTPYRFVRTLASGKKAIYGLKEPKNDFLYLIQQNLTVAGLKPPQVECIINALSHDHTKRPTMQEFTEIMKQV